MNQFVGIFLARMALGGTSSWASMQSVCCGPNYVLRCVDKIIVVQNHLCVSTVYTGPMKLDHDFRVKVV